jgi:PDZ domain-containing protein
MLYVRQRARVNVWEWVRASLDPDVDLFREQEISRGRSPEELDVESDAQMTASKTAATRAALEAAGFEVPLGAGVQVLAVIPSRPAAGSLEAGDVLTSVDGRELADASDLGEIVRASPVGTELTIEFVRDGESRTANVTTEAGPDGTPVIGVYVAGAYDFPVDVEIDTATIGGPSAGLAMTLTILDELTPGDLTGGRDVAVTGTIEEDGSVGEIGGISQKAVSARRAGADLLIVPACTTEEIRARCEHDLARARERAGDDMPVYAVASLDEALEVLSASGGDPVEASPAAR